MMKAGKPEPGVRDRPWRYPYRCKVHGLGAKFKVVDNSGKRARRCTICMKNRQARYTLAHESELRERKTKQTKEARGLIPEFEDGIATVSSTWLRHNVSKVPDYVRHGEIVVEILGVPEYKVVRL